MSNPKALSDNLILYTSSFFENTAKALVPNHALPKGKVVVHLGQPRGSAGFVSRDLLDVTNNFAANSPMTKVAYPLDAGSQVNATDNQIIRLQDGSLLAAKNGYIWSDLSPKPAWFDTTTISVGGTTTGKARNAVFIFRSTDGGASWTLRSSIDSAVVEGGKFGWPQPGDTAGVFGVGGFDRTELYQDPWSGDIFVSGHGDGGPYMLRGKNHDNHAGVIFQSQDNGQTWKTFHVFDDAANTSKGAAPYMMTSTFDHPLIVFHSENSTPTLYFVEKGVLSSAQTVTASDGASPLTLGGAADVDDVRGSQCCVARLGKDGDRDSVWIAYPSLNSSSKQFYVIATVTFGGTAAPIVNLSAKVSAEDSTRASAVMGAFVYDDLVDVGSNETPTTLFYWIDAPSKNDPSDTKLVARYKVFYSGGGSFPSGYLSVSAGAKRKFTRTGIGDYFSGGYFWLNGQLNFLCQWNESDGIKANIVSMTAIPKRHNFYEAAIDPLALVLSNQVYVLLTLPDPPPPDVLRSQFEAGLRNLSIAQRRNAINALKQVQKHVNAIAGEYR